MPNLFNISSMAGETLIANIELNLPIRPVIKDH